MKTPNVNTTPWFESVYALVMYYVQKLYFLEESCLAMFWKMDSHKNNLEQFKNF